MSQDSHTSSRRTTRRWIGRILRWAVVIAVLVLAIRFLASIDWRELQVRLLNAQPGWVLIATACLLLRWVAWAQRWQLAVLRLGPSPNVLKLSVMVIASAALNHLTPAARVLGGPLRARYLSHQTSHTLGRAFGSVLFDQLVFQLSMTGMTILALAVAAWSLGRGGLAWGSLIALLAMIAGLGLAWHRMRRGGGQRLAGLARRLAARAEQRRGKGWSRRAEQVLDHGREAVAVVRRLLDDGPLLVFTLALGVLYALVNAAALWAVFLALGDEVSFSVSLAAVALGVTAGALLGTPGGVGTAEAAIVASLVALGVDQVDATAGALLYRGLHYVTVFVGGLPALAALELRRKRQLRVGEREAVAND